jgi:hypothetical protein
MSEPHGGYGPVILFALILAALAVLLWLRGHTNGLEKVLIVATVFFSLFVLIKQRWALAGVCCTLLLAINVYFAQAWLQPIVQDDTSLIVPNVAKMLVGVLFLILLGRQSIEHRMS